MYNHPEVDMGYMRNTSGFIQRSCSICSSMAICIARFTCIATDRNGGFRTALLDEVFHVSLFSRYPCMGHRKTTLLVAGVLSSIGERCRAALLSTCHGRHMKPHLLVRSTGQNVWRHHDPKILKTSEQNAWHHDTRIF